MSAARRRSSARIRSSSRRAAVATTKGSSAEVGERGAAPEGERLGEHARGRLALAVLERDAAFVSEPLEHLQVERVLLRRGRRSPSPRVSIASFPSTLRSPRRSPARGSPPTTAGRRARAGRRAGRSGRARSPRRGAPRGGRAGAAARAARVVRPRARRAGRGAGTRGSCDDANRRVSRVQPRLQRLLSSPQAPSPRVRAHRGERPLAQGGAR